MSWCFTALLVLVYYGFFGTLRAHKVMSIADRRSGIVALRRLARIRPAGRLSGSCFVMARDVRLLFGSRRPSGRSPLRKVSIDGDAFRGWFALLIAGMPVGFTLIVAALPTCSGRERA